MFRLQSSLLLVSMLILVVAGRHFGIVLTSTALSVLAVLFGPPHDQDGDPTRSYAQGVTLIVMYFLNDLALWFGYNEFKYFNGVSVSEISTLFCALVVIFSLILSSVFAVVYSKLVGASKLLLPYVVLTIIGLAPSLLLLDIELDRSPQTKSSAVVVGKEVILGGARSLGHELQLQADDPRTLLTSKQRVDWPIWDRTHIGDRICFYDHLGLLNIKWRKIDLCR